LNSNTLLTFISNNINFLHNVGVPNVPNISKYMQLSTMSHTKKQKIKISSAI